MNSFITWIGGKNFLKKIICENFPTDYKNYIEVFGGAAWVLFYKDIKAGEIEIYNDLNSDLFNLFRVVKAHPDEFVRQLEFLHHSRDVFNMCKEQYKNIKLTDIQRAVYFYYLIKLSFATKLETFSTGIVRYNMTKRLEFIHTVNNRLNTVKIENLDFEKIINKYDRTDSFFYLDPPYYKAEKLYKVEFTKDDHERLFNLLKNIKGKFLLSYNDHEYIRDLYKDYNMIEVERQNSLKCNCDGKKPNYKELLIKNY